MYTDIVDQLMQRKRQCTGLISWSGCPVLSSAVFMHSTTVCTLQAPLFNITHIQGDSRHPEAVSSSETLLKKCLGASSRA